MTNFEYLPNFLNLYGICLCNSNKIFVNKTNLRWAVDVSCSKCIRYFSKINK